MYIQDARDLCLHPLSVNWLHPLLEIRMTELKRGNHRGKRESLAPLKPRTCVAIHVRICVYACVCVRFAMRREESRELEDEDEAFHDAANQVSGGGGDQPPLE